MYQIDQINQLSADEFVAQLGGIYEHSPWVAMAVERLRPFSDMAALQTAMQQVVNDSGNEKQLALLKAHPEFAGKAATQGELTEASTAEQGSLSLNNLPPEQHKRMQALNRQYMDKFGFPGIVAVRKQSSVEGIFALLEQRLANDIDHEKRDALAQVHLIAECRLQDLIDSP